MPIVYVGQFVLPKNLCQIIGVNWAHLVKFLALVYLFDILIGQVARSSPSGLEAAKDV